MKSSQQHHYTPNQSHPANTNVIETTASVFNAVRMIIGLLHVNFNHLSHHNTNRWPKELLPLLKEILMMKGWNWIQTLMDGKVIMRR